MEVDKVKNLHLEKDAFVFVSANAGCGKTKILVDRFISLIENGSDINKILCITYTNEAVNEMKERVINELILLHKDGNNKKSNYILENLSNLKIMTFHSFCTDIIKSNLDYIGLNENFEILTNENKKNTIKDGVKISTLEMDDVDEFCEYFIKYYGINNFFDIFYHIIDNFLKLRHIYSNYEIYLSEVEKSFNSKINVYDFYEVKKEFCKNENNLRKINNFSKLLRESNSKKAYESLEFIKKWLSIEDFDLKVKNIDILFEGILTKENKIRNFTKEINNSSEISEISLIIEDLLLKLSDVEVYNGTKMFFKIANFVYENYENIKNKYNFLDYDDIIHFCGEILNKNISNLIDFYNKYDHFLIDEAQDLSKFHWSIIDYFFTEFVTNFESKKKTFFIVGDEKQSIYSFQGADVSIFSKILKEYPNICDKYKIKNYKIKLDGSYRSGTEILNYVNEMCDRFYSNSGVDIWKNSNHKSLCNLKSDVIFLNKSDDLSKIINDIFDEIQNLISKGFKYKDVLVLVKNRKNFDIYYQFINKAKELNIPISFDKDSGDRLNLCFFDIISILSLFFDQENEFRILCSLKNPIFNFSDEDIRIVMEKKEKNENIVEYLLKNYEDFTQKIAKIKNILDNSENYFLFLKNFFESDFSEFFHKVYSKDEINYILDFIFELIEINYSAYLSYFILSKIDDIKIGKDLNSKNEDKINLMTIHSSKGLQSRVVFFINYDFEKKSNSYNKILYSKPLNNIILFRPIMYKPLKHSEEKSIVNQILKLNENLDAEELKRLFYVAITRPKEILYVFPVEF